MLNIMLTDLVPIFVIMILGYVSGKKGEFNAANARSLNQFVLNYALPAGLFVSIVKADRAMLFSDIRLSLVSLGVIVGCYFWSYFSCLKFFKHSKAEASIAGLVGGAPTIGYLGTHLRHQCHRRPGGCGGGHCRQRGHHPARPLPAQSRKAVGSRRRQSAGQTVKRPPQRVERTGLLVADTGGPHRLDGIPLSRQPGPGFQSDCQRQRRRCRFRRRHHPFDQQIRV